MMVGFSLSSWRLKTDAATPRRAWRLLRRSPRADAAPRRSDSAALASARLSTLDARVAALRSRGDAPTLLPLARRRPLLVVARSTLGFAAIVHRSTAIPARTSRASTPAAGSRSASPAGSCSPIAGAPRGRHRARPPRPRSERVHGSLDVRRRTPRQGGPALGPHLPRRAWPPRSTATTAPTSGRARASARPSSSSRAPPSSAPERGARLPPVAWSFLDALPPAARPLHPRARPCSSSAPLVALALGFFANINDVSLGALLPRPADGGVPARRRRIEDGNRRAAVADRFKLPRAAFRADALPSDGTGRPRPRADRTVTTRSAAEKERRASSAPIR